LQTYSVKWITLLRCFICLQSIGSSSEERNGFASINIPTA
jgi:hypothetical protein